LYKIAANTDFIGKKIIFLPSCHSTNDIAQKLPDIDTNGTVIVADIQTKGRGRQGKDWESEPAKNLTFSALLRFEKNFLEEIFDLSVITANSLVRTLQDFLPDEKFFIKWPNDIFVRDKKAAGILIENSWSGKILSKAVIGIGLNVNQDFFENPRAISLKNLAKKEFSREAILHLFCEIFEAKLRKIEQGFAFAERNEYQNLLYGRGEVLNFSFQDEILPGKVLKVLPSGRICIEFAEIDAVKTFDINELNWILP
jgi:BirA family biotin operon repressor/biotin-[acetyl-CoA-carboxylase] ligase